MIEIRNVSVKNIISKSKLPGTDYVINPYIGCPHKCIYCYADFMCRFSKHSEKWGDFLDVKHISQKINKDNLDNKTILISSVTDAYNPFEAKFRKTREILLELKDLPVHIDILTKSNLVLLDIDLFKQFKNLKVGISLNTLDDDVRKQIEPYASSIEKRIDALKTLRENNIDTYLFISPIFPGITDIESIVRKTAEHVNMICFENLNIRSNNRQRILDFIGNARKDLLPLYNNSEILNEYWKNAEKCIKRICIENNIKYELYFYHKKYIKNGTNVSN